jgi:hypothetical protein
MLEIVSKQCVEAAAKKWQRNVDLDREQRQKRMLAMDSAGDTPLSAAEAEIIRQGASVLQTLATSPATNVAKREATIEMAETYFDASSGQLTGRVTALIRGATPIQVAAYVLNADSHAVQSFQEDSPSPDVRFIARDVSAMHTVTFHEKKATPFTNRTFMSAIICKKRHNEEYLISSGPITNHPMLGDIDEANTIRGEFKPCWSVTAAGPEITKLEFCCSVDLKGYLPRWFTNTVVIPQALKSAYDIQVPLSTSRISRAFVSAFNRSTAQDAQEFAGILPTDSKFG